MKIKNYYMYVHLISIFDVYSVKNRQKYNNGLKSS